MSREGVLRYVTDFTKCPRNEFFFLPGLLSQTTAAYAPAGYSLLFLFNDAVVQSVTKLVALIGVVQTRER